MKVDAQSHHTRRPLSAGVRAVYALVILSAGPLQVASAQEFENGIVFWDERSPVDLGPDAREDCGCTARFEINPIDSPYLAEGDPNPKNLFHEFLRFDSAVGAEVAFVGPGGGVVENIVATIQNPDGDASKIGGHIRSEIDGASLFLINPDGFVFGEDSSVDVKGSLYIATADSLILGDDGEYEYVYGAGGTDAQLFYAEPSAFGFAGHEGQEPLEPIASISLQGRVSLKRSASDVHLMAVAPSIQVGSSESQRTTRVGIGPREVDEDGNLPVSDARIDLLALGGLRQDVPIDSGEAPIPAPPGGVGASVSISNAELNSWSSGGKVGRLVIRAGQLVIEDSYIEVGGGTESPSGLSSTTHYDAFDAVVSESATVSDSLILSAATSGQGGDYRLEAESILLRTSSLLTSATNNAAAGRIRLGAISTLELIGGSHVNTRVVDALSTVDDGSTSASNAPRDVLDSGGHIVIDARSIHLWAGSSIKAVTAGSARAGDVEICAGRECSLPGDSSEFPDLHEVEGSIMLRGGGGEQVTEIGSLNTKDAEGATGRVKIAANIMSLTEDSRVNVSTDGPGAAGEVELRIVGELKIDSTNAPPPLVGKEQTYAGIYAHSTSDNMEETNNRGPAGVIDIEAGSVSMLGGAVITTKSYDSGPAEGGGPISITAINGGISISDGIILASAAGGDAGRISLAAESIRVDGSSVIEANNLGAGRAGSITLDARRDIEILAGSKVASTAEDNRDSIASDIALRAGRWLRFSGPGTEVKTRTNALASEGGNVNLDAAFITLENSSVIASALEGDSIAGNIVISPGRLFGRANSVLEASARTGLNEGRILVESPEIDILNDLAVLQQEFLDVTDELGESCMARKSPLGSFQVRGASPLRPPIDRLPGSPDGFSDEASGACELR